MRDFRELAEHYRMAALVEVHDEEELKPAHCVGRADRSASTIETCTPSKCHLRLRCDLADKIPAGVVRVAESGIHSSADVQRLRAAGYQAFLVGEHLDEIRRSGGCVAGASSS